MTEERETRITVSLGNSLYEAIRKFAFDNSCSLSAAVRLLCAEELKNEGYWVASNEEPSCGRVSRKKS